MMKCYMYYIKPVTINELNSKMNYNYINDTDEYILYAYTSSKKLAKKFEKQRKMDYFIKKVIDIDDIPSAIAENKLVEKSLDTKNSDYEVLTIDVVLTQSEYSTVTVECQGNVAQELLEIEMCGKFEILKDEIVDLLARKLHMGFYSVDDYQMPNEFIEYVDASMYEDISSDGIDELEMFIIHYGFMIEGGL